MLITTIATIIQFFNAILDGLSMLTETPSNISKCGRLISVVIMGFFASACYLNQSIDIYFWEIFP